MRQLFRRNRSRRINRRGFHELFRRVIPTPPGVVNAILRWPTGLLTYFLLVSSRCAKSLKQLSAKLPLMLWWGPGQLINDEWVPDTFAHSPRPLRVGVDPLTEGRFPLETIPRKNSYQKWKSLIDLSIGLFQPGTMCVASSINIPSLISN